MFLCLSISILVSSSDDEVYARLYAKNLVCMRIRFYRKKNNIWSLASPLESVEYMDTDSQVNMLI